jgi:hypothetical protein
LTATGRAILQRQQLIAEEEARVKRLQEEEEKRIREEEARLEAEQRAIEEEKERKRKLKHDKVCSTLTPWNFIKFITTPRSKLRKLRVST